MKNNRLITFLLILTLFALMTEMEDKIRTHTANLVGNLVASVEIDGREAQMSAPAIPLATKTKSVLNEGFDSAAKVLINN